MSSKKKKTSSNNLIEYLLENYFNSLEEVETAVKLGIISINNKTVKRPGVEINLETDKIKVVGDSRLFVSRGGYKLQKAIEFFELEIQDKICLDIGASTGGFTDCLLQYGAQKIYAIDTGYGQLAWKLRTNPKVKCLEKTNVRYLMPERLYEQELNNNLNNNINNYYASLAVIDVSFISAVKLIPNIQKLLIGPDQSDIVVLVKPQFEAEKNKVGRGGIIRNPSLHFEILFDFIERVYRSYLNLKALTYSPILGNSGNLEFLAHFEWNKKNNEHIKLKLENFVKSVIAEAYEEFKLN